MSKQEKIRLLNAAMRTRERRRAAYHARRDQQIAAGISRLECWVPTIHAQDIKALSQAWAKALQTGQAFEPIITRIGHPSPTTDTDFHPDKPEAMQDTQNIAGGYRARRRAQTARARARKKERDLVRISLVVPEFLKPRIAGFAKEVTARFEAGETLMLESWVDDTHPDIPAAEGFPSRQPAPPEPAEAPAPPLQDFQDLFTDDPDWNQGATLFEDIHAAQRVTAKPSPE